MACLVLWALLPNRLFAIEPLESPEQYAVPSDLSSVHFYLISVDVGDMVWDNFGHTALRVFDEVNGTDTVYNWGGFDTSGGVVAFSWNFFKGVMNYQMSTQSPSREFSMYRAQQRTLWQDKLNLSNPQKELLYRRLLWNMQSENVVYPYHYFFDNCTTRVRDYLDEALGGKIAEQFDGSTQHTFRELVQSHYASVSLVGFSLDILMNSNIDRRVSQWEEMFLPLSLRQSLLKVESAVALDGERLMLLSDSRVLMEFPPPNVEADGYQIASLVLLIPLLFLLLMLKKIPMSYFATHSRIGLKGAGVSFRILGGLGIITGLFSGIYGFLMLGSWFVSDHLDLHHNLNLLLFWPTDLFGIVVAMRWLIFCKPWPTTNNSMPFINYYLLAHGVGMVAFAAIHFFGLSMQSIGNITLYVVPGYLAFTFMVWMVGFEPAKPKRSFY